MKTLLTIQEQYIADMLEADTVTTRFGHRTKAYWRAHKKARQALEFLSWPEPNIRQVLADANDMYKLEKRAIEQEVQHA